MDPSSSGLTLSLLCALGGNTAPGEQVAAEMGWYGTLGEAAGLQVEKPVRPRDRGVNNSVSGGS